MHGKSQNSVKYHEVLSIVMEFGKIHCIVKCAKIRRDKIHFFAVGASFFAIDVKKKTKSGPMVDGAANW